MALGLEPKKGEKIGIYAKNRPEVANSYCLMPKIAHDYIFKASKYHLTVKSGPWSTWPALLTRSSAYPFMTRSMTKQSTPF
jgi:hypothetical protein